MRFKSRDVVYLGIVCVLLMICVGTTIAEANNVQGPTYSGSDLDDIFSKYAQHDSISNRDYLGLNENNFAGFFNEDGISTERIRIYDKSLHGYEEIDGHIIPDGAVEYYTEITEVDYKSDSWEGESYPVIGFFGEKYIPLVNDTPSKLTKLIIDDGGTHTLENGDKFNLGNGFELEATGIDDSGEKVRLEFTRKGKFIDDEIISLNDPDPSSDTWIYEENIATEDDVPIFRVSVSEIHKHQNEITIDGLWLIEPEDILTLDAHSFDSCDFDLYVGSRSLAIVNDDPINLIAGSVHKIGEKFEIQVVDSTYLRFYVAENPVEKYALLIGVNKYIKKEDKNLTNPKNNANAMYDLLVKGYGYKPKNIKKMVDFKGSVPINGNEILYYIAHHFQNKVDSNDIFVLYYSGHGGRNETFGKEYITPNSPYLSSEGINNELNNYKGTVVSIFDSCHSGGMAHSTDIDNPSGTKTGIERDNTIVLMSCEADEGQYEIKYFTRHTFFTSNLYEAFTSDRDKADTNKDERVSIEEAFQYSSIETLRSTLNIQSPQISDEYPTKNSNFGQCYLSDESIKSNYLTAVANCPINLHAYDSEGRHIGSNGSENATENEISGAYYNGPSRDPQKIVILGKSNDTRFKIEGLDDGVFNFTLTRNTEEGVGKIDYRNVPVTKNAEAFVNVSSQNKQYIMEIDNDGNGIIDEIKKPDSVEGVIPPIADFTTDKVSGSVPLTVHFTDTSTGNSSFLWNFGDGTNSTEENPTHTYTESGMYTVSLTVENEYGNSTEMKTNYIEANGKNGHCIEIDLPATNPLLLLSIIGITMVLFLRRELK